LIIKIKILTLGWVLDIIFNEDKKAKSGKWSKCSLGFSIPVKETGV
jgi:hypothetical protein